MQTLPFSEARAQLAQALRSVEAGDEPVAISRRGQIAGLLMSFEQYRRLSGETSGFAARLQAWRDQYLVTGEVAAGDDPFAGVRQLDAEREFSW